MAFQVFSSTGPKGQSFDEAASCPKISHAYSGSLIAEEAGVYIADTCRPTLRRLRHHDSPNDTEIGIKTHPHLDADAAKSKFAEQIGFDTSCSTRIAISHLSSKHCFSKELRSANSDRLRIVHIFAWVST